jgi:hypothetical protein
MTEERSYHVKAAEYPLSLRTEYSDVLHNQEEEQRVTRTEIR